MVDETPAASEMRATGDSSAVTRRGAGRAPVADEGKVVRVSAEETVAEGPGGSA